MDASQETAILKLSLSQERHVMLFNHIKHLAEKFDHQIENKGSELVITLKGEPEELKKLEKALKAMKDLHEACCSGDDDSCCGGKDGGGHCC